MQLGLLEEPLAGDSSWNDGVMEEVSNFTCSNRVWIKYTHPTYNI